MKTQTIAELTKKLEAAAAEARWILDPKGGTTTRRDGMFEIWGEAAGGCAECIARETTKSAAIAAAIKRLEAE